MKMYIKRHGRNGKSVTTFLSKQLQGSGYTEDAGMHVGVISKWISQEAVCEGEDCAEVPHDMCNGYLL
jgi:hypothetical protein